MNAIIDLGGITSLAGVRLPEGLKALYADAATSLADVELPKGLKELHADAVSSLAGVRLPKRAAVHMARVRQVEIDAARAHCLAEAATLAPLAPLGAAQIDELAEAVQAEGQADADAEMDGYV